MSGYGPSFDHLIGAGEQSRRGGGGAQAPPDPLTAAKALRSSLHGTTSGADAILVNVRTLEG